MAYKYSKGPREFGDIKYESDPAETQIDFEDDFVALKTGGNQVLVVSGSDVGIGISAPTQNLHVVGPGNTTLRVQGSDGYYGALNVKGGTGDSAWLWQPANTSELRFFTVDDDRIVILGSGEVGIATNSPNSGLTINSSLAHAYRTITANYTVTDGDYTIFVNAGNANLTVTLPTSANIGGRMYIIKRVDSSGNTVTISPDGSETIDGASSIVIASQSSAILQSDNSNWWKVAEYIVPP
tara:strand:- start:3278 stop:3994 length:717 start_codon:yes stop_codon:yes gene_type:complete